MTANRIDFQSADAARFNQLRDQWRSAAASCALSRAGLRVAGVLPTFVNREYGYAFPTDDDLALAIGADQRTAKRGLVSLDEAKLIERKTIVKRDPKGEAIGKARRIYLTLPVKGQPNTDVKGQNVKGQGDVKGQDAATEGTPVCPYIPDTITPDTESAYEKEDVLEGTYTRDVPSAVDGAKEKKAQPHSDPSVGSAAPASSPAQKPNSYLAAKNGDAAPSVRWQDAKHPKALQGRPLSRRPFPAPKTLEAAHAFFRKHHVPETEWPNLLPNLMAGHLYEFDIEPWMDAA